MYLVTPLRDVVLPAKLSRGDLAMDADDDLRRRIEDLERTVENMAQLLRFLGAILERFDCSSAPS